MCIRDRTTRVLFLAGIGGRFPLWRRALWMVGPECVLRSAVLLARFSLRLGVSCRGTAFGCRPELLRKTGVWRDLRLGPAVRGWLDSRAFVLRVCRFNVSLGRKSTLLLLNCNPSWGDGCDDRRRVEGLAPCRKSFAAIRCFSSAVFVIPSPAD